MAARFDDHFTMMARDLGGCEAILDTVFGFLRRRTDFYKYAVPGSTGGLPPGLHEQLIFSHYMKFREEYNQAHPPPPGVQLPEMKVGPPPTEEQLERVVRNALKPKPAEGEAQPEGSEDKPEGEPMSEETQAAQPVLDQAGGEIHVPAIEKDPEDSWVVQEVIPRDNSISTFNGADTGRYRWNQDVYTVQFQIKVPPGTRGNQMKVDYDVKHIKVYYKKDPENPLLEGELVERITPEDCIWIMDGDSILVTMYKAKDVNWKGVIVGDPEIDPKTVDTTRRVDEYDADTQAGLNKALTQQGLNLQGRMTEEQEEQYRKMQAILGNPNSPLKGHMPSPTQMFHLGPPKSPEEMMNRREPDEDDD